MILAGISMMHNEADVAPFVVKHMLNECDFVLVADHGSTDGTRAILEGFGTVRMGVREAPTEWYDQAGVMMSLVDEARERGADWVIPFDADEWWEAPRGSLRSVLEAWPKDAIRATTVDMIPQPGDTPRNNPWASVRYYRPWTSRMPENRKIAFRPFPGRRLMQGNHGLLDEPTPPVGPLRIRHLPYRSLQHAMAKLRRGRKVLENAPLPQGSGWHWRTWGALDEDELVTWWNEWTDPKGLVRL